jgi:hypothetical protein
MPEDEITPIDDTCSELSDQELEDVSGGLNLQIIATRFSQRSFSSGYGGRPGGCHSGSEQSIESAALQITLTDATTEDLKIISKLLSGADAIEDD